MIIKTNRLCSLVFFACTLFLISCAKDGLSDERIPAYTAYTKDAGTEYLEIMVYGDAGTGGSWQKMTAFDMSRYASKNTINFIINLGDSFYNTGVESIDSPRWDSTFESIYNPSTLNMPFYSILGNHDYGGNIQAQIDYVSANNDRWQMPDRYYQVSRTLTDETTVDFFFLDTVRLSKGDATQLAWLVSGLQNSHADWKVVSGHHPLYSNGVHGSSATLIDSMQNILSDNNVDLYLAGHEHDMQILKEQQGVYYIVNGSAAKIRETYVNENTVFAVSRFGFMTFLFSAHDMVCQVFETQSGLIYSTVLKTKSRL